MTKKPKFDYNEFCQNGFQKKFPILAAADPEEVANWLYETVSAFSGRDGQCICGGGDDDIRCLIAAASAMDLEVCNARKIKDKLRTRLRLAWLNNNHSVILKSARGFERGASMLVIDYRDVAWVDPYRIVEDEEEKTEIPEEIETWIETLCEPSLSIAAVGNHSRNRERRKPVAKVVNSLFGEAL